MIAAKELGHTHIRALCIDHLNKLELRAFMLAHNKLSEGSEVGVETLKVELLETAEVVEYDFSVLGFDAAKVTSSCTAMTRPHPPTMRRTKRSPARFTR